MRMVFGLGGLLLTLAVMVFIWHEVEGPSIQQDLRIQKQADQEINQIAGKTDEGNDVQTTYKLFADLRSDGKIQDFQVTEIDPNSPMKAMFGLKANDVIISVVGEHGVPYKMTDETDEESARLHIREAYTGMGQLIVQRGDQTLTLPLPKNAVAPSTPKQTAAQNSSPKPPPPQAAPDKDPDRSEQGVMDQLKGRLHTVPTN